MVLTRNNLIKINDNNISKRSKDENGYLIVKDNPICVAGVFDYLLSEVEQNISQEQERVVKVFRPFEDIEQKKDYFANKPIIYDHQWVGDERHEVDGAIGSIIKADNDKKCLYADIIFYNPKIIDMIEKGEVVEFSPGYLADLEPCKGYYNGEQYEYKQTLKSVNHLALVENGRAGNSLKVNDNHFTKGQKMAKKSDKAILDSIKKMLGFKDEDTTKTQDEDLAEKILQIALGEEENAVKLEAINEVLNSLKMVQDEEPKEEEKTADECNAKDEEVVEVEKEKVTEDEDTEKDYITKAELLEILEEWKTLTDTQAEQESKKTQDAYNLVKNAISSDFYCQGMKADEIFALGYKALTNKTLDKALDSKTAFLLAKENHASKNGFNISFKDSATTKNEWSKLAEFLK